MSYNYDPSKGGIKNDQGKNRLELVPPEAILAIGEILTHGASKYEDRNWEKGMPLERVYGACQRHLQLWASGCETDPESGKSHLEHALCNLAMMVTLRRRAIIPRGIPNGSFDEWTADLRARGHEEAALKAEAEKALAEYVAQRQEQGIVSHRDYSTKEARAVLTKADKHPREIAQEEFKEWRQEEGR